ncbi:MAG: hypothetical protein JXA61_00105 [Bacteroidales bacterium]|nr:hypothetical protein [Bacteroidales bacterium]
MKNFLSIALALASLSALSVSAQRINLESGSFDFLVGQESLLVKYDYSNISVGKYENEEDYLADRVEEYNNDEPGKGDQWKEAWLSDRPNRFEPKFEEVFNENIDAIDVQCSQTAEDATYEMIVHTTFVEPGYNVGISRKSAFIDAEIIFREVATGTEMAVLTVDNCQGLGAFGFDFDTGYRIEEAYAMLGRTVARYVLKRL